MKPSQQAKQWQAEVSDYLRRHPDCSNVAIYAGTHFNVAELTWLAKGFRPGCTVKNQPCGYVMIHIRGTDRPNEGDSDGQ